ncbi:hypothetical protein ACWGHM_14555 [Streptomyces sp. NPDC054904]
MRSFAEGALQRVERALDLAYVRREPAIDRPCQCGGRIEVYGGAGTDPVAQCGVWGAFWTARGVVAA